MSRTSPKRCRGALKAAVLFAGALLAACGKEAAPAVAPPGPNANAPIFGHLVTLAEGSDLAQIRNQQMLHPLFELLPDAVAAPLIFGVVEDDANHTSFPLLARKAGGAWRMVKLSESPGQEWEYAAACPERGEIWAVLDAADGATAATALTMMRSGDAGSSWQYFAAVRKPAPLAEYAGFSIARSGEGRLSMHLEDDDDLVRHGYYHYSTTDGGKTWTGPTYEADDIVEATPVKNFDTLQEAIKAAEVPANTDKK